MNQENTENLDVIQGMVTDILVDNEQMVEYGQPMFVIKPV
jgi:biotin carboxyl carrier protein